MTLDRKTKTQIRTVVLLELNSCFTKLAQQYADHDEAHKEFLHDLIDSVRDCIEDKSANAQTPFNQ